MIVNEPNWYMKPFNDESENYLWTFIDIDTVRMHIIRWPDETAYKALLFTKDVNNVIEHGSFASPEEARDFLLEALDRYLEQIREVANSKFHIRYIKS